MAILVEAEVRDPAEQTHLAPRGAIVALRPGALVTTEELSTHARARLAYFEIPSRWWIHEGRLPVTASGKFDKPLLRRSFPTASSGPAHNSKEESPS